jgi:hypothetical protein
MTAIHFPSYNPLCILNRDLAVSHSNGNNKHDHQNSKDSKDQYIEDIDSTSRQIPANDMQDHSGRRETIPAKIIREIPLPIPLAVICSPIHISNIVPAVKVTTMGRKEKKSGIIQ